jgi:hypothetical protein
MIDRELRKALSSFAQQGMRNPLRLFEKIYVQCVSLQQPNEFCNGQANLCDGCLNMMMYEGELIPSCRLDEYRLFGGPMTPIVREGEKTRGESVEQRETVQASGHDE